ncbi:MAG: hypothetical protein ACWGQW_11225 [bacterium]
MNAVLGTRYQRNSRKATVFRKDDHLLMIPVYLTDVEFFANSKGSVNKIVSVEVAHTLYGDGEDLSTVWVSPEELYDVERLPLVDDIHFAVWAKRKWLALDDPSFEERFDMVRQKVESNELEDDDAFDAVEDLGFNEVEADIILNEIFS